MEILTLLIGVIMGFWFGVHATKKFIYDLAENAFDEEKFYNELDAKLQYAEREKGHEK